MFPLSGSPGQMGDPYGLDYFPSSEIPFPAQKMHACTVCGKLFVRPSALSTHMNSHVSGHAFHLDLFVEPCAMQTGDKPFECPICKKGFGVASNLRRYVDDICIIGRD